MEFDRPHRSNNRHHPSNSILIPLLYDYRPTHALYIGDCMITCTPFYSLCSSSDSSEPPVSPKYPGSYTTFQNKRCNAVLQLVCIEKRTYTGPELLSTIHVQAERWMSPSYLQNGKVLVNNDTKLLAMHPQG